MRVTRFTQAEPYEAPNHRDVRSVRLQGFAEGGPEAAWVGLSNFLPGGGAGPDASPLEKVYVVLEGEMTVIVGGEESVLHRYDSCTIPGNVSREIVNRGDGVCAMMVIMPYPDRSEA
jgi:quercetin dioxygenase-like cupin family protein